MRAFRPWIVACWWPFCHAITIMSYQRLNETLPMMYVARKPLLSNSLFCLATGLAFSVKTPQATSAFFFTQKASPLGWVFSQAQHPMIKTYIKIYSILCSKTYSTFSNLLYSDTGSRQVTRSTRLFQTHQVAHSAVTYMSMTTEPKVLLVSMAAFILPIDHNYNSQQDSFGVGIYIIFWSVKTRKFPKHYW